MRITSLYASMDRNDEPRLVQGFSASFPSLPLWYSVFSPADLTPSPVLSDTNFADMIIVHGPVVSPRCANETEPPYPYHHHSYQPGPTGPNVSISTGIPTFPTSPVVTGLPQSSVIGSALGFSSSSFFYSLPNSSSVAVPLSTGHTSFAVNITTSASPSFPTFANSSTVGSTGASIFSVLPASYPSNPYGFSFPPYPTSTAISVNPTGISNTTYPIPTGGTSGTISASFSGFPSITSAPYANSSVVGPIGTQSWTAPIFTGSSLIYSNSAASGILASSTSSALNSTTYTTSSTGTAPVFPTAPYTTIGGGTVPVSLTTSYSTLGSNSTAGGSSASYIPPVSPSHGPYTLSPYSSRVLGSSTAGALSASNTTLITSTKSLISSFPRSEPTEYYHHYRRPHKKVSKITKGTRRWIELTEGSRRTHIRMYRQVTGMTTAMALLGSRG